MTAYTPIVQIDTREQNPLDIEGYRLEVATLSVGDYGIKGFSNWDNPRFIIERKSLNDLAGSITHGRERFFRECQLLRQFQFAAIVIEGGEADVSGHEY